MVLSEEDELRQYGFTDELPHLCGNIAIKIITDAPDGMLVFMWGLRSGSRYELESHAHGHTLTIEIGSGRFSIAGEEFPYGPGDTFCTAGNVPHGFVRVETTTVVVQSQSADKKCCP